MGKEEFIIKAKEIGYTEDMIKEIIDNHEEFEKQGINIFYESELIELPINN